MLLNEGAICGIGCLTLQWFSSASQIKLGLQLTIILITINWVKRPAFFFILFYWQKTLFHILPNAVLQTNMPTEYYEK